MDGMVLTCFVLIGQTVNDSSMEDGNPLPSFADTLLSGSTEGVREEYSPA